MDTGGMLVENDFVLPASHPKLKSNTLSRKPVTSVNSLKLNFPCFASNDQMMPAFVSKSFLFIILYFSFP